MPKSNVELRREWSLYVGSQDWTKDWQQRHVRNVDTWLGWLGQRRRNALTATPSEALDFWAETSKGLSPSLLKQRLTALHGFYGWLQIHHVVRDPFVVVKAPRKRAHARREIVGPEQLVQMVHDWPARSWHEQRDRAFIAALVASGARVSEFCASDLPDVDKRRKALYIREGKGSKARWVSLVGALDLVTAYIEGTRPLKAPSGERALWINNHGNRLRPESARGIVTRICRRLGIEVNLTPHGVRASAITAVYEATKDIKAAKDYAGHERISTTDEHYIILSPSVVVDIAEESHPLALAAATKED